MEPVWDPAKCAVFSQLGARWGGLSNFQPWPITVNGVEIRTSEALYQLCRYPLRPDIQQAIIDCKVTVEAKRLAHEHLSETRPDWRQVNVQIMEWCLLAKTVCNWDPMTALLRSTGSRDIVERSKRDTYWGARQRRDGILVGVNRLGRLLTTIRDRVATPSADRDKLRAGLPPIAIPDFLILGDPIRTVTAGRKP